jgi:AP-3 complex subunit beta
MVSGDTNPCQTGSKKDSSLTVDFESLTLLAEKPAPQAPSPSESRKGFLLGSSTLVLAGGGGIHGLRGYEPLPDWVEEGQQPDRRLREPDGGQSSRYDVERSTLPASDRLDEAAKTLVPTKANGTGEAVGTKTLDDWLGEEKESEESSEETEEESSEEEDDEEDDDDEDDEEEEEEEETDSDDDDGEADRLVKS